MQFPSSGAMDTAGSICPEDKFYKQKQLSSGSTSSASLLSTGREDLSSTDSSLSDNSETESPDLPTEAPLLSAGHDYPADDVAEDVEWAAKGSWHLRLLHWTIYANCIVATQVLLTIRSLLALFFRGAEPKQQLAKPDALLSWEMLTTAADPTKTAREALPVPPNLPTPGPEGLTISFGPCANLMIYTGGVAACLQRCPNYREVSPRLKFYGVSCGAFLAAVCAADCELLEMLPEMLAWTEKFRGRLWGMIGAYSASVAQLARRLFVEAVGGPEAVQRFEVARRRLGIAVTVFTPAPERVAAKNFASGEELVTTLLGSCYIPVAFEEPQWSEKFGPLWDGGILEFATLGDVVASPYEAVLPDIHPERPYPKKLSFFPPHERDAVQLFEDGYMDCLRWLEAGAPSRNAARQDLTSAGSGFKPLMHEAMRFVGEVTGLRQPPQGGPPAKDVHQD